MARQGEAHDEAGAAHEASGCLPRRSEVPTYLCIDLKSFYASVECVERGLDPLTTNLVVADETRGRTTICLAVTPALKRLGVRNRCRLFEIPDRIDYLVARPRMRLYMRRSADIYGIYLRYVSPEDIHVYSIDECFIDARPYLRLYGMHDARDLACVLRDEVLARTGITATAGVGTNLFLAKVALDVTAKHAPDGIGVLDEEGFRAQIWHHRPITDIWNVGPGIARRLAKYGIHDLAGVALTDPALIRREFGVNAEYLIDHAWGRESCTIAQIHAYRPKTRSLSRGQILPEDYAFDEARIVLREMVDALALELVEKGLVTNHISLSVGYGKGTGTTDGGAGPTGGSVETRDTRVGDGRDTSVRGRTDGGNMRARAGSGGGSTRMRTDDESGGGCATASGGRDVFMQADDDERARVQADVGEGTRPPTSDEEGDTFVGQHGSRGWRQGGACTGGGRRLAERTNSYHRLSAAMERLFDETTDRTRPIRRLNIGFGDLTSDELTTVTLFTDLDELERERTLGHAVLAVKGRFGKNALLRGTSLSEKATARERNLQVGGHRA